MKIHVNVNQAQCIRIGVDAPSSTVDIEVDPANLTPPQREWVAANLRRGYHLDAVGDIAPPTLDGLLAAVDDKIEAARRDAEVMEANRAKWLARDIERVRAVLDASPERERVAVGFDPATGAPSTDLGHIRRHVETVKADPVPGSMDLSRFPSDLLVEIEIERVRRASVRKHDIAAALPLLHAEYLAERSKKLEEERAIKAARLDILRRGERIELIERIEAGVAPDGEAEQAIRDIIEADIVGAMCLDGVKALVDSDWEKERDLTELTAEQWAFVKRVRAAIDVSGCLQDVEWDYSTMTSPDGVEFFAMCLYRDVADVKCVVRLTERAP